MARGNASKEFVTSKILELFAGNGAFVNGKEIRIPCMEDGAEVQIKITLTAAKDNLPHSGEAADASETPIAAETAIFPEGTVENGEPSENEKNELENVLRKLGF